MSENEYGVKYICAKISITLTKYGITTSYVNSVK